jgi:large subunit ribosomal protein L35
MIKAKTHSGAKKRFRKKKSGLIKGAHSCRRHLLTKKSPKRKRDLRRGLYVSSRDIHHIAPLLPH